MKIQERLARHRGREKEEEGTEKRKRKFPKSK